MSYGDGYAFPGQEPVYPARYLPTKIITREVREDAYGEVYAEVAAELVQRDLEGECNALFDVHDSSAAMGVVRKPMSDLLRDLEATHLDDWLRLLAVCPVADQATVALNMQDWLQRTMQASRDITEKAHRIAVRRLKL